MNTSLFDLSEDSLSEVVSWLNPLDTIMFAMVNEASYDFWTRKNRPKEHMWKLLVAFGSRSQIRSFHMNFMTTQWTLSKIAKICAKHSNTEGFVELEIWLPHVFHRLFGASFANAWREFAADVCYVSVCEDNFKMIDFLAAHLNSEKKCILRKRCFMGGSERHRENWKRLFGES